MQARPVRGARVACVGARQDRNPGRVQRADRRRRLRRRIRSPAHPARIEHAARQVIQVGRHPFFTSQRTGAYAVAPQPVDHGQRGDDEYARRADRRHEVGGGLVDPDADKAVHPGVDRLPSAAGVGGVRDHQQASRTSRRHERTHGGGVQRRPGAAGRSAGLEEHLEIVRAPRRPGRRRTLGMIVGNGGTKPRSTSWHGWPPGAVAPVDRGPTGGLRRRSATAAGSANMSSSMVTPNASACSGLPGKTWVWASTRPGRRVWPGASRTAASDASSSGPTSTITPHQHRHPGPEVVAVEHVIGRISSVMCRWCPPPLQPGRGSAATATASATGTPAAGGPSHGPRQQAATRCSARCSASCPKPARASRRRSGRGRARGAVRRRAAPARGTPRRRR